MAEKNRIDIAYGKGSVAIEADPDLADWTVIRPTFEAALVDPKAGFVEASRSPIGSRPLREVASSSDRVVIVTSDGTRPVPNRQLIPWILEELDVPDDHVTVLLGNGTHRANTSDEIAEMFGEDLANRIAICNHDAYDQPGNVRVGQGAGDGDIWMDRAYVEADRRIVVGFIEPHFFAGFSGGAKGIVPGVAGIDTILRLHRAELIGDPMSTWGVMEGNPIQGEIAEAVALCPPDFMVNVTLNSEKAITGYYLGHYREAHVAGCAAAKASSMVSVPKPFPLVVTSNSGYPLDQNLYQTVKGMSAAGRIVEQDGTILVASECVDGVPDHGNFAEIMRTGNSADDVLTSVYALESPILDQWQAQVLARILQRADVAVYSQLDDPEIRACKLDAVPDLEAAVRARIDAIGRGNRVAVLPDGPLTIPFIKGD
ncbi:MAG: nickel-dependent lactate racemase [Candidatus Latescibacteria bacterium]|jgi:nickel-dependent lactate racemase|nr:nickel-dependent lactate racemase [Candidatus Latescibacterota bacterium]